ncbi:ABC transporter ATP-binding protein [Cyclobacterium marinum]|uniref:ABC transporter related protein n=1 Tax=Cyclobacterium marinum (strain ATCC 25205 / DSM 745 / LMG 13164 / NCIMB 1802) TaxID=880070 RepID=G0IXV5_CYCMS|nr:ABC transporter ATP-binding protein [Cyclobacterium marinum]AEL23794.1 ABC transporter related protein [Cyclobacterium marinum DSM 745]
MIVVEDLQFSYENQLNIEIPNIKLKLGEELLILGKSGSGKTTLLNILGGLLAPKKGEVIIDGTSLYQLKENDLDQFRGRNIGIVFQKPHLLKPLTVSENVALPYFFSKNLSADKVQYYLDQLGILNKQHARIHTLSEGEAQRVSIARALINGPKVILADEPTASLDDENANLVVELLKSQAKKLGAALIIVTHDSRIKNQIVNRITLNSSGV